MPWLNPSQMHCLHAPALPGSSTKQQSPRRSPSLRTLPWPWLQWSLCRQRKRCLVIGSFADLELREISQWTLQTVTNLLHYAKRSLDGICTRMSLEGAVFKSIKIGLCGSRSFFMPWLNPSQEPSLLCFARWAPRACRSWWDAGPAAAIAAGCCTPPRCGSADQPHAESAGKPHKRLNIGSCSTPARPHSSTPPQTLGVSTSVLAELCRHRCSQGDALRNHLVAMSLSILGGHGICVRSCWSQ